VFALLCGSICDLASFKFGALEHRANPNLWNKEDAWEREVVENYAID
jgi:hypothetical protein